MFALLQRHVSSEEHTMHPTDRVLPNHALHIALQPNRNHRLKTWVFRMAATLGVMGFMLSTPLSSPVLAKGGYQAAATPEKDPAAMEALNKLGTYLRSLNALQVDAEINGDDVLDDGQVIQYTKKVDLVAVRPNRLRVEITSDTEHKFIFYDGKNFTVFGQLLNYYATVPATGTIGELVDKISDKYDMELPLTDLFKWGTDPALTQRIKGAMDIGPTSISGVTCEQYAFHQDGADWQIWIQLGDFPLPRKLVIRTLTDEARPQYSETLNWNLAPSYSEDAFTFTPPPDAKRIVMAEAKPTGK
jgi:hypothetical protein